MKKIIYMLIIICLSLVGCSKSSLDEPSSVVDVIDVEELAWESRTFADVNYNICQWAKVYDNEEEVIDGLISEYEEELTKAGKDRLYSYLYNNKKDIIEVAVIKGEFQDHVKIEDASPFRLELFPQNYSEEEVKMAKMTFEVKNKLSNGEIKDIEAFINNEEDAEYRVYLRTSVERFIEKTQEETQQKQIENMKYEPYIGMSETDLINHLEWELEDINETINKHGTYKQYCYSDYRYVYVENGKVTSIQK